MNLSEIRNRLSRMDGHYSTVPSTDIVAEQNAAINEALRELSARKAFYWLRTSISVPVIAGATTAYIPGDVGRIEFLKTSAGTIIEPRTYERLTEDTPKIDLQLSDGLYCFSMGPTQAYDYYNPGSAATIALGQAGTAVTGASTVFTAAMVGMVITQATDNEFYWITARTANTTITVGPARRGAALTASEFIVNKRGTRSLYFYPAIPATDTYTMIYYRVPAELSVATEEPDLPVEFHDWLVWQARMILLHGVEERDGLIQHATARAEQIYRQMLLTNARALERMDMDIISTI